MNKIPQGKKVSLPAHQKVIVSQNKKTVFLCRGLNIHFRSCKLIFLPHKRLAGETKKLQVIHLAF